ncbi:MAG: serine/threonine protein kinase [Candidatus Accumulibacter sp.]|jgi:serine/threonine protein kinase|nr:serine/threonine protein kinase [Accumulibacter sp.]
MLPISVLTAGTQLQEFVIQRVIGRGGFGVVYLAHDETLDREVAIKEYLPAACAIREDGLSKVSRVHPNERRFDKGMRRFVNEAAILASILHLSLPVVLRFFRSNDTAYIVMPYYRGKTLHEMVSSGYRAKSTDDLLLCTLPILHALTLLHRARCYHLDISSNNILMREEMFPLLLDFGAARHVQLDSAHDPIVLKPGFAPVEQYCRHNDSLKVGPWSDIYALAAVVYHLVTGSVPVISPGRIKRDSLQPLTDFASTELSAEVLGIFDLGLRVRPYERPQTVQRFVRALYQALHEANREYTTLYAACFSASSVIHQNKTSVWKPDFTRLKRIIRKGIFSRVGRTPETKAGM